MDAHERLSKLERSGCFEEAATLAERLGDRIRAARAWQSACEYARAAQQWLIAGRVDEALLDAVRAGDSQLIEACISELLVSPKRAIATAKRLQGRGAHATAAVVLERLGEHSEAASAYQQCHRHFDAARLFCYLRQPDRAAQNLQLAIEKQPRESLPKLALASLLTQRGAITSAIRLLQSVQQNDALHHEARWRLVGLFEKLELSGVAKAVEASIEDAAEREMAVVQQLAAFEHLDTKLKYQISDSVILGRYEIIRKVTSTATAVVYEAFDRVAGSTVAVKLFSPSLVSGSGRDAFYRFEREIAILREIAHPAVVPALDYHPEGPALVLQWMSGGTLRQRLDDRGVSARQAALAASRVLAALGTAHRRGILHRDIKPDNVLYDAAGLPYLSDFGTAHVADHAKTVTQGMIGTLAYMAPAQKQGHPASVQSDLYSVGAVFWHALTGAPPGHGSGVLLDCLSVSQKQLALRLIDERAIPRSAAQARSLIDNEDWPNATLVPKATVHPPSRGAGPVAPAQRGRLVQRGSAFYDQLLEREVDVLDADAASLERARCFASADHAGLASILALRPPSEVWSERLPVRAQQRLEAFQKATLRAALKRLHRVGGYHGSIDGKHVGWRGSQPVLLFPMRTRPATLMEDLAKLDLLQ